MNRKMAQAGCAFVEKQEVLSETRKMDECSNLSQFMHSSFY
jgi:hypothetical protein